MTKSKKTSQKRRRKRIPFLARAFTAVLVLIAGYGGLDYYQHGNMEQTFQILSQIMGGQEEPVSYSSLDPLPEYEGSTYAVINDNIPDFDKSEWNAEPFEKYSELDTLGRCGKAEAMLSYELMPTEARGDIGMIKPSGWHTVKYESIEDRYLYNRCHLIAFELTGENDNALNLITGTRYMNVSGMLPWENKIAQYIRRTRDKVLYRVTPVYQGKELVARGVHMEARSLGSKEIQFNVYVFNVQPGIKIDYRDGESWIE